MLLWGLRCFCWGGAGAGWGGGGGGVGGWKIFVFRDSESPTSTYVGVSENRASQYSTLNSRILTIKTPQIRYP